MSEQPAARVIALRIDVKATLDEVWKALTTAEGLARWFPPQAATVPGPGGTLTLSWGPGEEWVAPIVAWEPHAHLGIVGDAARSLAVDFHLEANGEIVTVRLVHSGFDESESWDDYIDGLTAGWTYFLANLRHVLERHPGTRRAMLSARPSCRGTVADGSRAVFGAGGLDVRPGIDALGVGDRCSLLLGGERFEASVLVALPPRAVAFVLSDLNDALLFVEREGLQPNYRLGIWLSLYGVAPERVERMRQAVDSLASALAVREAPVPRA
ncbi:MAG TPA: SRPBCC domain-containing protein [Vicinamibacterales bacterium]|nr:SRPBCC domain-containing protein [Vicinamibacterales bacterium]